MATKPKKRKGNKVLAVRMAPEARAMLDKTAQKYGLSTSDVVHILVSHMSQSVQSDGTVDIWSYIGARQDELTMTGGAATP